MAIKKGSKLVVEYEGKFENGEVFDSSKNSEAGPLKFEAGAGKVIKGFDEAVMGIEKGEEKEFSINPQDAYGEYNPKLKKEIPRNMVQGEPKAGMMLVIGTPDGRKFPAKIEEVTEEKIVIDLNHPLAGKKLFFKIKILDVK